jgi:hypothetical protein
MWAGISFGTKVYGSLWNRIAGRIYKVLNDRYKRMRGKFSNKPDKLKKKLY